MRLKPIAPANLGLCPRDRPIPVKQNLGALQVRGQHPDPCGGVQARTRRRRFPRSRAPWRTSGRPCGRRSGSRRCAGSQWASSTTIKQIDVAHGRERRIPGGPAKGDALDRWVSPPAAAPRHPASRSPAGDVEQRDRTRPTPGGSRRALERPACILELTSLLPLTIHGHHAPHRSPRRLSARGALCARGRPAQGRGSARGRPPTPVTAARRCSA